jgi:hypothetical protein
MLMRWWPDMNLLAVESLRNIDQFSKQIGFAAELSGEIGPQSFAWHCGGLIRHRMTWRRKLSPLLFGRSIGWLFGLLLTPDRGQARFLSQPKLDTL